MGMVRMTMKRMLRMLALLALAGCGGGDGEGQPPSAEPGQGVAADSAQKDNTGPAGARTGG
jgi:ABC-type glycerol-3-phosphate transport system substrate-binding protein